MSQLNLLPWRERQRQAAMRRWAWGAAWMVGSALGMVALIDHHLQHWHQQHELQRQLWTREHHHLTTALADAPLWQARVRQAQQVKADGLQWLQQQQQAWRVLRRVLALPPQGVQMTHLVWHDKQLTLRGWAVSAAHLQVWQDALQAQRLEWHEAQWRQADGLAMRQHAFVLQWSTAAGGTDS